MERRLTRASKCVSVALFIFGAAFMVLPPPPTSLNSINIVTNEVATISNCEKYTIHITSNSKFYIENARLWVTGLIDGEGEDPNIYIFILYDIYLGKLRVIGHSSVSAQITIYKVTMTI